MNEKQPEAPERTPPKRKEGKRPEFLNSLLDFLVQIMLWLAPGNLLKFFASTLSDTFPLCFSFTLY